MVPASATGLYPVRSYEVDTEGRLRIPDLCNYLQESAGLHARKLGVSVEQLLEEGMTWFLWRLHLRIERLPAWTEEVTVETWPSELGKPFAVRDFRLRIGGDEIGVATSAWLLMDVARRRPIRRFPRPIAELHPETPVRALRDRFRRLPALQQESHLRSFNPRRSDLDLNGHLNHVATISAMLEAVPEDRFDPSRLQGLEVEFLGEGAYGDALRASCGPDDDPGRLLHRLHRVDDGKELARARSLWRSR